MSTSIRVSDETKSKLTRLKRDDETWGERVSALVVPRTETLSTAALETFCRERLAGYKLPRQIAFTDSLPRTASGTIKRPAVRDHLTSLGDDSETASDAITPDTSPQLPEDTTDDSDEQPTGDTDEESATDLDQSTTDPDDESTGSSDLEPTVDSDDQSNTGPDDESTADPDDLPDE